MKKKILGGVLLIASAADDYWNHGINKEKTEIRIKLIKAYESGKLSLQQLNEVW